MQAFLKEYLLVWDGLQDIDAILGLLSCIQIQPFQDAYASYLSAAERAVTGQHPECYDQLLRFYTDLLRQWMNQASPQPRRPGPATATPDQRALHDLASHVSSLSTSLLLSLPFSSGGSNITSSILTFYELLSTSSAPYRIPIVLPPMSLIYTLALSPSATTLSRVCGMIGAYKTAFNKHPGPIRHFYPQEIVDAINCCLRDIYNLLWISRALVASKDAEGKDKASGVFCDPALREALNTYLGDIDREYAIQTAFGLSNNPMLAASSAAVWRQLEAVEIDARGYDRSSINWHKGPVSQRSLDVLRRNGGVDVDWELYRVHVLQWLEERGCAGLKEFMFASSDALKKKYGA